MRSGARIHIYEVMVTHMVLEEAFKYMVSTSFTWNGHSVRYWPSAEEHNRQVAFDKIHGNTYTRRGQPSYLQLLNRTAPQSDSG